MTTSSSPRVLLVTSAGASEGAVTPVLAALETTDLTVRAIDVGRAGARNEGVLDWVIRPFASDFAERRLMSEMDSRPPDVAVTFDPVTTSAMSAARDEASRPTPVVAVVNQLDPPQEWSATDADRYLTIDDEAAVALSDMGIEGSRILTIGPVCELPFAAAGKIARPDARTRFGLPPKGAIVLLHVDGFGHELTAQIALQLSLIETKALFLFDAGGDAHAATALRQSVPTLGLNAKLFGHTEDAPLLWRCADIIVAKPSDIAAARSMVLGTFLVSFAPGEDEQPLVHALERRRRGTIAGNALLLSSALDPILGKRRKTDSMVGEDGAGTVADVAWIVAEDRVGVLDERQAAARASTRARVEAAASAVEAAARTTAAAGGLEDLSGGGGASAARATSSMPDPAQLAQLKAEMSARLNQISKTVANSQKTADRWTQRAATARNKGDRALARKAEQQADNERARMHAALAEMAQMQSEIARLEEAAAKAAHMPPPPPGPSARSGGGSTSTYADPGPAYSYSGSGAGSLEDELSRLKRNTRKDLNSELRNMKKQKKRQKASLDDELAALKRKMQNKKKP